jgi:hypothetical protein
MQTINSYAAKLNIPEVTLSQAYKQVKLSVTKQQGRGVFVLVGEAGVGKTQITKQLARELGYHSTVINTAHFSLLSAGIPVKTETDFFNIAVPNSLPDGSTPTILVFDELNRGTPQAISTFFNLIEDRRLFNYKLPDNCFIIGTMNPPTDGYQVSDFLSDSAMLRRLKLLAITFDTNEWIKYAKTNRFHANGINKTIIDKPCHPALLNYFKDHPDELYTDSSEGQLYCCPATVETLSEDLYFMEQEQEVVDMDDLAIRWGSSIGHVRAHVLVNYYERNQTLQVTADDILEGYTTFSEQQMSSMRNCTTSQYVEYVSEIINVITNEQPKPNKNLAKNLARFLHDVPLEAASVYFTNTKLVHNDIAPYVYKLQTELLKQPEWGRLAGLVAPLLNLTDSTA